MLFGPGCCPQALFEGYCGFRIFLIFYLALVFVESEGLSLDDAHNGIFLFYF